MSKLKVGYVALSKASWKTPEIERFRNEALAGLKKLPYEIIDSGNFICDEKEAIKACDFFTQVGVQAVVMHFATFPVGAIIPIFASKLNIPFVLFANPENPPLGGTLEQNSFCGANMGAHVMHRMGKRYSYAIGLSSQADNVLSPVLNVFNCIKQLEDCRIGLAGGRVPGFYTSNFDEMRLRKNFGTAVEIFDVIEVVDAANKLADSKVNDAEEIVKKSSAGSCKIGDECLDQAARLLASFKKLTVKYSLDTLAVRCWPEFSDIYGIAPCAVIGMLNDIGIPTSCEGDVLGAMTMQIQKNLAGGGWPFFVDLISTDIESNTGVVWHCGAAPISLCRNFADSRYRLHMRVDGGDKKGLTNDFSLKPGRITLAKLDESETGYRMLIAGGEAIETEQLIRGNPLRIKFDGKVSNLVDTIMKNGFEHHYSVIHADIKQELISFCELMNIEFIIVE
jgi:L-fucose isomerase-like protein